jgi:hypothetical protein
VVSLHSTKQLDLPFAVPAHHYDRYPNLVSHVFSVCTPYTAPSEKYMSTEDLVKGPLPQFAYQLHLASGEVEKIVKDEQSIRQFLKGMYGAKGPNGEITFDPEKGILGENLTIIGESRVLNGKVCDDLLCCNACQVRDRRKEKVGMFFERQIIYLLREHCEVVTLLDRGITTSSVSCSEYDSEDRLGLTPRPSRMSAASRLITCIALFQKDSLSNYFNKRRCTNSEPVPRLLRQAVSQPRDPPHM